MAEYIPHDDPRRAQNLEAFEPIKDESGQPIKLFHNTNRDFSKFNTGSSELGAHFGTANQAANLQANQENPLGNRRTMAVHLRLKNPLRLMDQGGFSVERVAQQLYDMDMINEKKYDKHMEGDFRSEEAAIKDLQSTIQKAGYDGIVYLNRREGLSQHPDPEINQKNLMWHFAMSSRASDDEFKQKFPEAEDSYIAFQPTQIKSATGNQGTFDPSNPDITKRDGGDVEGLEPSIDMSIDKQNNRLSAKAIDDWNKAIGHATFNIGDNNELDPQHVEVHEDYRKSGIAKKLYDHVARRGYKIIRSNDQTDAGHAFWNKHQGSNKVWRVNKEGGGSLSDDGITAYHGSPHDFEQFDISKVGTGEGNQSYGHGLYFAGNENVARNYRDRLGRQDETSGETMADQYVIPRHFYQDISEEELAENMKEAARWSEQQIFDQGKMHYVFDDGSMLIHDDDEVRAVQKHPGHMYEVHINAHPDHMLDWDAPLSGQSEHVKNALLKSGHDFHQMASDMFDGKPEDLRGADIYHWLSGEHEGGLGSAQNVADHFSQKGIRGIKYLDAGSRGATDMPTRNYVVFDHNNVAVKRKYARGGMVDEVA